MSFHHVNTELGRHAPFTFAGTATGIVILAAFVLGGVPAGVSESLFWSLHPLHVLLSALVTTAMYRLHGGCGPWRVLAIGYFGSVGIATVSDCLIPYVGEWMLGLPNRGVHLGFVEKWWLVNPLALAGVWAGWRWPRTRVSHAGHVLLSTWASLFHLTMALDRAPDLFTVILMAAFLFLAVWVPCCTSDIVLPLLFSPAGAPLEAAPERGTPEGSAAHV